ncbi:MAG: FAD-binding oxidoreductase [Actinobacteria bacterium]|nr:FAD-binding oxidoreductase [Actinomycetota bacterium]
MIVGGGVIGAATAFHASRAGMRPLILERRPALSTLTTAAAAGGFRLQLDSEDDVPLVAESVELFLNFADLTGQSRYDPDVRRQGYLWVTTEEPRAEAQRAIVASQRGWGVPDLELLSGDDARRAFPFLGPEVRQARFRAGDGLLDPKRLTLGLAAGSGASVVTGCSVRGFRVRGDRLVAVETDAGAVATRAAVIAAGPFSGVVAAKVGIALPISTVVRQKLVLPDVPQVPASAPMTIDDDSGAHWRPVLRGASLFFTDPAVPPSPPTEDVPVDQGFAFRLLDPGSPVSVARVTPFWSEVWDWGGASWLLQAGQYTMTPDRRPLIGPTGVEGLYVNTGYSGKGVMAGPAGSRHLVDLLLERIGAHENPFRLDRSFGERPHVDPL